MMKNKSYDVIVVGGGTGGVVAAIQEGRAGAKPIAINLRLEYPISNTECPIMK